MKLIHTSQVSAILRLSYCYGLLLSSLCFGSSSAATSTSLEYQQQQQNASSRENDDDYLSQKEHILENSYHGLIRENETLVEITPLIKVDEEKICDFHILRKPYHEIPFQIEMVNNLGILKARRNLNCENRKSYHFEIVAIFCDGTHSASANVHITVVDINEYAPIFMQPSYVTEVDEGRLYKEIIRVEAVDKDCTPLFGDICKYEILNNDQPFVIDNEGSIKNIEPLSHTLSHNHILSVIAYDCAMKESTPIMVSIKVKRMCEARLSGIPERIDYTTTNTENLYLFPNIRLELCDMYCKSEWFNIHTSITLKTKHISFGCDRDIKNCSIGLSFINLLPRGAEWTKVIKYDEGPESVFHFDGLSGVILPENVIARQDFSTKPFSIITMFRHSSLPYAKKHLKEHIVCSADDHKMNRHHMALFVRNCRLILLLRKNFSEGDLNIFSPAEWRWKIPQVCDNEWHHYVLNVDQSTKIELYIDGKRFDNSVEDHRNNPEVIDDWPLHASHGIKTTFAVGACYQSSENRLKHGFNGDISEIKLSLNNVLSANDVKCGTNCAEHLLPPPEKLLEANSQVQTNSQLNEVYIEGKNKNNIEQLLQKVQYINTKQRPTIGRRNIEVRTTIMCVNQSAMRLSTVETYIMVNELGSLSGSSFTKEKSKTRRIVTLRSTSDNTTMLKTHNMIDKLPQVSKTDNTKTAKISIIGKANHLVSYHEIKKGVHILENIKITIVSNTKLLPNLQNLDSCSVIVFPSLNPDHEDIQVDGDGSLSTTLDIKTNINKDGVEMIGYDTIENYIDVLKALVYSNKKPAYYLNRVFKLSCSQLNTQFKSAEFTLTLTVLHPKQTSLQITSTPSIKNGGEGDSEATMSLPTNDVLYAHTMMHSHNVEEPKSKLHAIVHKAENSQPTLLIISTCFILIILLSAVYIMCQKNTIHKHAEHEQPSQKIADDSLVWDDSALTITINPLQNDVTSEDSSDSDNSDSDEEDDITGCFSNMNQLEWDNSNMFDSTIN